MLHTYQSTPFVPERYAEWKVKLNWSIIIFQFRYLRFTHLIGLDVPFFFVPRRVYSTKRNYKSQGQTLLSFYFVQYLLHLEMFATYRC